MCIYIYTYVYWLGKKHVSEYVCVDRVCVADNEFEHARIGTPGVNSSASTWSESIILAGTYCPWQVITNMERMQRRKYGNNVLSVRKKETRKVESSPRLHEWVCWLTFAYIYTYIYIYIWCTYIYIYIHVHLYQLYTCNERVTFSNTHGAHRPRPGPCCGRWPMSWA